MKRGNSKWAYFSYSVDGKNIYLKNRIHVSMSTKIVEKNGGKVKILSFVDNISTTEIINKIIEAYKN